MGAFFHAFLSLSAGLRFVFENQFQKRTRRTKKVKYAPKKVIKLENGRYTEISYLEFCSRKEQDACYKDKLFLPM